MVKQILVKVFLDILFRIEFGTLAVAHQAVNLGQGFIDYEPPEYFLDIYSEVVKERNVFLHQYTRGFVCMIKI